MYVYSYIYMKSMSPTGSSGLVSRRGGSSSDPEVSDMILHNIILLCLLLLLLLLLHIRGNCDTYATTPKYPI